MLHKYQFCCWHVISIIKMNLCAPVHSSYLVKWHNYDCTLWSASMYWHRYMHLWIHLIAVLGTQSISKIGAALLIIIFHSPDLQPPQSNIPSHSYSYASTYIRQDIFLKCIRADTLNQGLKVCTPIIISFT